MAMMPIAIREQRRRHYLGPELAGDGITVHRLGLAYDMPPGLVEWRTQTGDWLFMVFHDPVTVGAADGMGELAAPGLAVWNPSQAPRYGHAGRPWCHSWLHASGPLAEAAGRRLALRRTHRLDDETAVMERIRMLSDQVLSDPDPVLVGYAAASLLHILVRQCAPDHAPPPDWLLAARSALDARFREPVSLAAIARQVGRTPTHFSAAFKSWMGVSPKRYLLARRLDEAAFRLRQSGPAITEVAAACGFADVPHFTRLFRQRFGVPPGGYRRGGVASRTR